MSRRAFVVNARELSVLIEVLEDAITRKQLTEDQIRRLGYSPGDIVTNLKGKHGDAVVEHEP